MAFQNAEVGLEPTTVFVGPNDAGKSTLAEAIACLYDSTDLRGRPFSRETVAPRSVTNELQIADPSWVLGEYVDLDDHDDELWGIAVEHGVLRHSVFFDEKHPDGSRCAVLSSERAQEVLGPDHAPIHGENGRAWVEWQSIGDVAVAALVKDASDIADEAARSDALRIAEQFDGNYPNPIVRSSLVHVPGPDVADTNIAEWLSSFVTSRALANLVDEFQPEVKRLMDFARASRTDLSARAPDLQRTLGLLALSQRIRDAISDAVELLERSYGMAISGYVHGASGVKFSRPETDADSIRGWIEAEFASLAVDVVQRTGTEGDEFTEPLAGMGAGTQRAAVLASLELLRDAELGSGAIWTTVLVEEPETGLHAAAQRRAAANLSGLATYGLQTIVFTHSPTFARIAGPESIRIVRPGIQADEYGGGVTLWRNHQIEPVGSLKEVADLLGVEPADVLLSSALVLVEGPSDAAVISTFSEANGLSLQRVGVSLIPVGGSGMAAAIARVLSALYTNATVMVVLDNGRDTASQAVEIQSRFGDRVVVRLLDRTEIEAYFSISAVHAWLADQLVEPPDESSLREALSTPRRKSALRSLTQHYLHREYRTIEDGVAIARHMREAEIPPEMRSLVTEIAGLPQHRDTAS